MYYKEVFFVLVKIFDEEHEKDLELVVNDFLIRNKEIEVIDIKYTVAITYDEREQIYCYSCLIMYKQKEN